MTDSLLTRYMSGPTKRRWSKRKTVMSAEVKNVSGAVREVIKEVKEVAAEVSDKLRQKKDEAKQALGLVSEFGDELGNATAELRALLGVNTNNPPPVAPKEEETTPKKKAW